MLLRVFYQINQPVIRGLKTALVSVSDLLFPQVCVVCENSLVRGERYLCTGCLADFPFTDETYTTESEILGHFAGDYTPERLHSLFYYNKYSNYKNLIYAIKYHFDKQLGVYLGRMLGEHIAGNCRADCIVPVPLHKKREKERGFNQSYQIALGVSEILGLEIINDVVFRVRNNVSQTGKNAGERLENVEDIFELHNPQKISGRHVLLLDDVITTGATMGSCLNVLTQAQNVRFSLGCLARAVSG